MIANGQKDIEMRLYDDKRKAIKIGDIIQFENVENQEKLEVVVLNLYIFDNFEELYQRFDKTRLGYLKHEQAFAKDMEQYYSKEAILKNKVIGIHIKVLK